MEGAGNPLSEPTDSQAYRFPVSVKGIIMRGGSVILLKNERDEWELPGGKLELEESPQQCVRREIKEELDLEVADLVLLDCWVYEITQETRVLIVTFGCHERTLRTAKRSEEHKEMSWVPLDELVNLTMPEGYKNSIASWVKTAVQR